MPTPYRGRSEGPDEAPPTRGNSHLALKGSHMDKDDLQRDWLSVGVEERERLLLDLRTSVA